MDERVASCRPIGRCDCQRPNPSRLIVALVPYTAHHEREPQAQQRASRLRQCGTYDAGSRAERMATRADSILAIGSTREACGRNLRNAIEDRHFVPIASALLFAPAVVFYSAVWRLPSSQRARNQWRAAVRGERLGSAHFSVTQSERPSVRPDCRRRARDRRSTRAINPAHASAGARADACACRESLLDARHAFAASVESRCRRSNSGRPRCRAAMASWISGFRSVASLRAGTVLPRARDIGSAAGSIQSARLRMLTSCTAPAWLQTVRLLSVNSHPSSRC